jgi:hypothetical protein
MASPPRRRGVPTMADSSNRTQVLSHEEIVKNFIAARAIDFAALGNFVAENGESIAMSGSGDYGVRVGWYNTLACFWRVDPRQRYGPIDIGRGIASEIVGP